MAVKKATTTTEAATPVVEPVKEKKTYQAEDLIPVRSVTQGELLMPAKKSGILYRWLAYGDVTEVEYQDLYALKASKSGYLYTPCFVIEDEELLADTRWKDLKTLYDAVVSSEDLDVVFKMTAQQLRKQLPQMPEGLKKAITIEASTRIESGLLDSLQKIKAIDEACGTDLMCLIK